MKTLKLLLFLIAVQLLTSEFYAQNITADTTRAGNLLKSGTEFLETNVLDSALINLKEAILIYEKHKVWERYLKCKQKEAITYRVQEKYDKSLNTILNAITKTKPFIDSTHLTLALAHWTVGRAYQKKEEYDNALSYYLKTQVIFLADKKTKPINIVNLFWYRGKVYFKKKEYKKAIVEYNDAIRYSKKVKTPIKDFIVQIYYNIALCYERLNDYDNALLTYKTCMRENKELADNQMYTAWSYDNSAYIYGKLNKLQNLISANKKAIRIYSEIKGKNYINIGYCLDNIAWAYNNLAKHDSAVFYRKELIPIYQANSSKQKYLAKNYYQIGLSFHFNNQPDSAIKYYNLHFQELKNRNQDPTVYTTNAYYNIGQINSVGNYKKAITNYKIAYKLKQRFYKKNDINLSQELDKIVSIYKKLSLPDSANKYSKLALQIYSANTKDNEKNIRQAAEYCFRIGYFYHDNINDSAIYYYKLHNKCAESLPEGFTYITMYSYYNLGNIYYDYKDYNTSLKYFKKALKLRQERTDQNELDFAKNYKMIAYTHSDMKQYEMALINYKKSLEYFQQTNYIDETIKRYFNVGFCYGKLNRDDSAMFYYQTFISEADKHLEIKFSNRPYAYSNLANLYYNNNQYVKSAEMHKRTIKLKIEEYGADFIELWQNYNDLGNTYHNASKYNLAINNYEKAINILKIQKEPNFIDIATTYRNIAGSYKADEKYDSAFYFYKKSIKICTEFDSLHFETANSHRKIAIAYHETKDYTSELFHLNEYIRILKKTNSNERIETAYVYTNYGNLYYKTQKADSALIYDLKALNLYKKISGENSKNVAVAYNNLGKNYLRTGDYKTALEYYNKALNIYSLFNNGINNGVANTIANIAVLYEYDNKFDKAEELYKKALNITIKSLGNNHYETAKKILWLATMYKTQTQLDSSIIYYKKALKIYSNIYKKSSLKNIHIMQDIADVYRTNRNADSAKFYINQAFYISNKYHPNRLIEKNTYYYYSALIYNSENQYDTASVLLSKAIDLVKNKDSIKYKKALEENYYTIATSYLKLEQLDKAKEYSFMSLNLKKQIYGENYYLVSSSLSQLGTIFFKNKEYNLSLEYYNKALNILSKQKRKRLEKIANLYLNIGICYDMKNEHKLALEKFWQSFATFKNLTQDENLNIADVYLNISSSYTDTEQYDDALDYANKALKIYINSGLENTLTSSLIYNNIGFIYSEIQQNEKALNYYKKSIRIKKAILKDKHPSIAAAYSNILSIYFDNDDYIEALKYGHKALCANLKNYNDTSDFYACPPAKDYFSWYQALNAYRNKSLAFYEIAKKNNPQLYENTLLHLQACDTILNSVRKEMKTKADKISIGNKAIKVYDNALRLCWNFTFVIDSLKNTGKRADKKLAKKMNHPFGDLAFYFSEKNKSSVLLESLAGAEAQKFAGIPENLLSQEASLGAKIADYKKTIASGGKNIEKIQNLLFSSNRSYDSLMSIFEKNCYYKLFYSLGLHLYFCNISKKSNMDIFK